MREDRVINVFYHERLVGTLAMTNERKIILMAYGEYLQTVCLMHGDSCCLTGC